MIYAINKRTKEHRIHTPGYPSSQEEEFVESDADGWIPWEWRRGNPLPDGSRCDVLVSGRTVPNVVAHDGLSWECVTHYRPILDTKPEAPEWRGPQDGNPPAGTPVSVRTKECDSAAMVLANDHNIVVVRYESGLGFKYGGFDLSDVRPIRSAEDEAVHAMRAQDCEPFEGMLSRHDFCRAIYAAIRDGKIPGVKLEDAS